MPAFGENLRREREMRGVSLEEISSVTKISMRFLEAIEREDFSKLPGGIFSRSFVRSYVRYLGLDEERVMAEYQLAAQPQADFDLHRMVAGKADSGRPTARTPLIATLVSVVLLTLSYALFRISPRSGETPVPSPLAPVVTSRPAVPPPVSARTSSGGATTLPGGNPPPVEPIPGAVPSTPTWPRPNPPGGPLSTVQPNLQAGSLPGAPPSANTELVLQVAATDSAWVAVDADGKTVLQRVLNPNEVETLNAHRFFDVTTGNAQSVILTLNGETLKPLGRRGEVKSVHLTREDLKNSGP
jgi:cytoskeleton protein RodZ